MTTNIIDLGAARRERLVLSEPEEALLRLYRALPTSRQESLLEAAEEIRAETHTEEIRRMLREEVDAAIAKKPTSDPRRQRLSELLAKATDRKDRDAQRQR